MKFFVTGVNGQLGHDVMNELSSRSYEGIGSDIAPKYSGIQDDSPVTKMPYISLDITDKEAVTRILKRQHQTLLFTVLPGLLLTLPKTQTSRKRYEKSMPLAHSISLLPVKNLIAK